MKQRKELGLFVSLRRVVLLPLLAISLASNLDRLRLYGLRNGSLAAVGLLRRDRDGLGAFNRNLNGVDVFAGGTAELEIGAGATLRFGVNRVVTAPTL